MNKLHVGTMGWGYDFWRGNFYPLELNAGDYLKEYSKHFKTVEVDSTFYSIPHAEMVENWRRQTPNDFIFSAKFPQAITQDKMLSGAETETRVFMEKITLLKEKLGPLLIQLSYDFSLEDLPTLVKFLAGLPKGYKYVVEARNKGLFDKKLYSLLEDCGVALALVDHPFVPRAYVTTANFAYIRLEGDRRKVKGTLGRVEVDRCESLKSWAEIIKGFIGQALEVYVYCSKFYSGHSPTDAEKLISEIG